MPFDAYTAVLALLNSHPGTYSLHEHEAVITLEDAALKVPHLCENLLKTVVFRIKDGDWILAAVTGHQRIHYKKLADALGVKRTDLRAIAPQDVVTELGFEIGGVGPFAIRDDIRVVIDAAVTGTVFCGSGRNTCTIEMDVAALSAASTAIRAVVTKPEDA